MKTLPMILLLDLFPLLAAAQAPPNGIELEADEVQVPEGGTATVRIRLRAAENRTVTVSRFSGDADLTVTGGEVLTFTPANWDQWQTVAFSFAGDADLVSSDEDGMDDDWETVAGVTDPEEDDDDDGVRNLDEFRAGTDPLVPASRLEIQGLERLADGRVRVTWNSNQDRPAPWTVTYSVFVREEMDLGDWTRIAAALLPEGVFSSFVWTPDSTNRFFLKIEAE